jgi:hypothetical protein
MAFYPSGISNLFPKVASELLVELSRAAVALEN